MDLSRYLRMLRRRGWLILLLPLLGAMAAYYVTNRLPKVYEADTDVLLQPAEVNTNLGSILTVDQIAANYSQEMTEPPIMQRVIDDLGIPRDPGTLADEVRVGLQPGTTILRISVVDADPTIARNVANGIFTVFNAKIQQDQAKQQQVYTQRLEAEVTDLNASMATNRATLDRLNTIAAKRPLTPDELAQQNVAQQQLLAEQSLFAQIERDLAEVRATNSKLNDTLTQISPASLPGAPATISPVRNVAFGIAFGLLMAVAVAFLLEYLDQTIKSDEELTRRGNLVAIAHIPWIPASPGPRGELAALAHNSVVAEAYKALRTNLVLTSVDRPLRSIMVTSPLAGEGKSRTAANLAVTLAAAGHETVLVDADFRRGSLHKIFGQRSEIGLSEMVADGRVDADFIGSPVEGIPNLWLVTTGPTPPNPSEMLGSERMKDVMARMRFRYRYIILDTPPVNAVTDATVLGADADSTIIVIEEGRTAYSDLLRTTQSLERVNARVMGAVINKLRPKDKAYHSYYYPRKYTGSPDDLLTGAATARRRPWQRA